ncbi:cytochrome c5 family protein [Pseudoteredinibacter isoporae]|nr:cytochrome c5 family protein [Pseudoteredinibacter isoporae]NIB24987.1 cytochrome c5 family protein [Pseudoteredinibacter isoporae]
MGILMLAISSVLLLSACGGSEDKAAAGPSKASLRSLAPSDPQLAAIYQRSCKACHGTGAPAIPQSGDVEAWKPRAAKGMDTLLDNVINGVGGMPPLGMCMDCDPEQFEALIQFMAGDALSE